MEVLSREDNEFATRIGPGTAIGDLMRQYWVPALLSSELPGPDSGPIRVLLLGEKLVAFRDTSGRVGLLPHNCPHRGASLFFGRNEDNGLRCVYHGWKYDVTGRCVDMPSEPPDSDFKHKVKPRGYPCTERAGVVWAYLGPREQPPPMPAFEPFDVPPDQLLAPFALQLNCNWLQALEGDTDTCHVGFLHIGHGSPEEVRDGTFIQYMLRDRAPRYKVLNTEFGATYGAYRPADTDDELYWRIGHFLFPLYTMPPVGVLGRRVGVTAWIPMDDHHTIRLMFGLPSANAAPPGQRVGIQKGMRQKILPNTTGWLGRFRPEQNEDNDYLIDRESQRRLDSYTGIGGGNPAEDQAVTESMGGIYDRTQERLGTSDMMVIRVRRRLMAAAKALTDEGVTPPGVDEPEAFRQRSGGVVLPKDADWIEATRDLRRAGVEHPELDPSLAGGV
ncbi:MAG: Rieske 2Fe-2S domain-containing protein [Streptosporangiales bacterium]|nr:Rieske 2Fe-2S domain-containing protein [Streptosporangiales bacterium]